MTKKLMRGLVPVMVLSAAAALFTGCGSKEAPADTTRLADLRKQKLPDPQQPLRTRKPSPREVPPRIL